MKINIEQDGNDNNQNNTFNLNIPEPKERQAVPSNVGKSTVNFVGREDDLTLIHQQLQTEQGVIVCAVEGLGGIGKTALALEYAKRYQQEYAAQYWLSLRLSGLAEEIVKLAGSYL
jgi:DNA transposition AAA+ family ATPase